jgi:hypothetical protein
MEQPTLLYLGTDDSRIQALRRRVATLRECGCAYLEFEGLDHTTSGLSDGDDGGARTTSAITDWVGTTFPHRF